MRTKAIGLVMTALLASAASGQPPAEQLLDRVFHFTHDETAQDMGEIATAIRSTTDIQSLFSDAAQKALGFRGTAGQTALAEWLITELDRRPSEISVTHEYRLPGSGDDVVRVFYLMHPATPQRLQEIAVQVRTTADIRRLITYNAPRASALRGTADQMTQADPLIKQRARECNPR